MNLVINDGLPVADANRTQNPQVLLVRYLKSHDIHEPLERLFRNEFRYSLVIVIEKFIQTRLN